MNEMENQERPRSIAPEKVSRKKRYEPPRILYRETLEAMAALCTPAPPSKANPGSCPGGPPNS